MTGAQITQKLWNYCDVLRDEGLGYGDYLEQLTFLLFLKMADERVQLGEANIIPKGYDWPSLRSKDGDALEEHYRKLLQHLGQQPGLLGLIYRKAQNKVQNPAQLRLLIKDLIDKETWTNLEADVKGDAYEGLLEKNAQDVKGGAGQYFTPRPVIEAMIECVRPEPGQTILDPAAGTGGFLLAAHSYITSNFKLNRTQNRHLRYDALRGVELVDGVVRLCAMNLMLHGVGPTGDEMDHPLPVERNNSLLATSTTKFDKVVTNPPFGRASSVKFMTGEGDEGDDDMAIVRDDFWATTRNKQLNFMQHIVTCLKINGEAAVVLPDNVLFEGGAGETIRRRLLNDCDLHTILRLPTGIFYAQGVKANVLFFQRKAASEKAHTKAVWYYDLRTNKHFTLVRNRLRRADLDEFVACYKPEDRSKRKPTWTKAKPEGRWRKYTYDELITRDKVNLDITWLRDESLEDGSNLPPPEIIAQEIVEDLRSALTEFEALAVDLGAP
ncbi:MAG: SAM-dependent DNA methyltransferase [Planctomycetota bacterium]|nr:MAG: SAM-dependent DNA methyltransferase [Planctomycetota bacterium]